MPRRRPGSFFGFAERLAIRKVQKIKSLNSADHIPYNLPQHDGEPV